MLQDNDYVCLISGCNKKYTRKYCLTKHQAAVHGLSAECTKNFQCPFSCDRVFRTNVELINHCEKIHDDKLGKT